MLPMPYQPSAIPFDTQLTGMTWTAFAILAMFWLKFDLRSAFLTKYQNIQYKLENVTQLVWQEIRIQRVVYSRTFSVTISVISAHRDICFLFYLREASEIGRRMHRWMAIG